MKTVAEIMAETAVRVDDPAMTRFTPPTLRTWIAEGAREVARRTECLRADSAISVPASTQTVYGPNDMVRIHHAQFEPTGSDQIFPLDYRDRKSMDPLWGTHQAISTSAYPSFYTTWNAPPNLTIMLAPIPSSAGVLRVFYYRLPASISVTGTDDANYVDIPQGWEDVLTTYAEARAYRTDRRSDDYQIAMGDFQSQLMALMQTSQRYSDSAGTMDFDTSYGWFGSDLTY